jgi:hypothetical protein
VAPVTRGAPPVTALSVLPTSFVTV